MALLKNTFQTEEVEDVSFEPIPAGEYTARVTKSDIKTTRAGNGEYIALQVEIMDEGPYNGRIIFENFNIVNPNEQAVKIARSSLKQLCSAVGITDLEDTAELHGTPFRARVKITPARDGYDASNAIAKYMSLDGEAEGGGEEGGDPWED